MYALEMHNIPLVNTFKIIDTSIFSSELAKISKAPEMKHWSLVCSPSETWNHPGVEPGEGRLTGAKWWWWWWWNDRFLMTLNDRVYARIWCRIWYDEWDELIYDTIHDTIHDTHDTIHDTYDMMHGMFWFDLICKIWYVIIYIKFTICNIGIHDTFDMYIYHTYIFVT